MRISSKQLKKLKYVILEELYNAGTFQFSTKMITGLINGSSLDCDYDDNDYTLALNELKTEGYIFFENLDLDSFNCKVDITEEGRRHYEIYADICPTYKHPKLHFFKTNILPILDLTLSTIAIIVSIIALIK